MDSPSDPGEPYEFDFFDVVEISTRTRTSAAEPIEGVVLGKSQNEADGSRSYAVALLPDGLATMFEESELRPTGRRVARADIYPGESIRASVDGDLLG
ncbi:Imm31 family immunity protein [Actinopolymorpha pittospori]|uniref:Uncharacterized protein n=1 Tax=Actinopolymorpha pittospori TaxID=648752 RepID=A0A927R5P4_9ACTN|nr:Imm31 family immunity protein [Actinopolymorpha pittospori]MBE1603527.1 hypothetical protein [Actinopolymorpha pittospori]